MLEYNSVLYLSNGLNINFINNTAQSLGGAIYASCENCQRCTFQHSKKRSVSDTDISLYFANNMATLAGDAIYSTNLYYCYIAGDKDKSHHHDFYWKIFKNISPKDISSKAVSIYFCNDQTSFKAQLYPGATLHVPVSVYDSNNSLTYDTVTVIPVGSVEMKKLNWEFSKDQGSTVIKGKDNCTMMRTGAFCGECITNYSVVFDSRECKSCTSIWWPLTSIIYLLAGPLLVFLLYTFRLTLTTGTLNGIIFYAQTANIGITRYLSMPCSDCGKESFFVELSKLFIAWLNLNLGFPLCFYDGMTELWKAGLSLLFPVYLILIIAFLVLLSRFSFQVSNKLSKSSVQVLVTVVHLSFAKLLEAVIDVFGSAKVYEEVKGEKIVWYNSGAVDYGSTEHMWLMIITSLVVGVILIPYFVLILFGKVLLKFDQVREYIRPFYEAIHAPYKPNRWYWFSLYQIFLLLVYVSETSAGNTEALFLVLFIIYNIFLYLQTCSMPFRNKALNLLNLSLLLALNFAMLIGQYIDRHSSKYLVLFFTFSNYYFILIFCFILAYHVLLSTNQLDKVIFLYQKVSSLCRHTEPVVQHSQDYPQLREPLLEEYSSIQ